MATGSIRERNGRFYVRTRVLVIDSQTGQARWKQVEKAAGPSRRRAQKILRGLQGDVDDGRYIPSSISVLELGRKWLSEHVEPNLKPGAAANYRGTFYRHVAPGLGSVRVDDCAPQMVRALLGQKRAEGLSEETVAKIRRHVHAMFAFAQDAGLVTVNPADAPRMRGRKHSRRRARGTELSPVQVKRFLEACSPRWRLFFTVALDTGLRRGELIGLRWGDIDLLERILYVRRSIGSYDEPGQTGKAASVKDADQAALAAEFDLPDDTPLTIDDAQGKRLTTKTEASQRLVPILDGAQTALEKLYLNAQDTADHAPVFATIERKPGRDGIMRPVGRPLSPRMVTRVFRRYADRAGLPQTIRLHDLRHTAITNAIGQGEDILLVSAFAGHAKTSTTVDVYGHLMPDRVREAARRMRSISHATPPNTTPPTTTTPPTPPTPTGDGQQEAPPAPPLPPLDAMVESEPIDEPIDDPIDDPIDEVIDEVIDDSQSLPIDPHSLPVDPQSLPAPSLPPLEPMYEREPIAPPTPRPARRESKVKMLLKPRVTTQDLAIRLAGSNGKHVVTRVYLQPHQGFQP